jgi:hypothetical protein
MMPDEAYVHVDCVEGFPMHYDLATGNFQFDPAEFGLHLSWDEFQAELADEFDRYNDDDSLRDLDTSPGSQEYARLSVLELLLSPGDAIQFCDNFRKRLNLSFPDPMILRVLWQNRDAIDALQNSKN